MISDDGHWCDQCGHPVSYHTHDRGCSMPVVKGTTMPRGRNDRDEHCEECPCRFSPNYVILEEPA